MIILDDSVILEGYKTGSMPGELSLRTKEYNLRNSCMHKKLLVLSNFAKQYCSCLGRWGGGGEARGTTPCISCFLRGFVYKKNTVNIVVCHLHFRPKLFKS